MTTSTHPNTVFPTHTLDSAPTGSRPALERLRAAIGVIPNLAATMSESPALIETFVSTRSLVREKGTFTTLEGELIALVNAVENGCAYCAAIHSTFALTAGAEASMVEQLRNGGTPEDPKLAALVRCTRQLVRSRGWLTPEDLHEFLAAGHEKAQVLELIARLALSILANYAAHLTHPEPDAAIRPHFRQATPHS